MTSDLELFTATARRAANEVIDSYSTSFGKATRLLGARHRKHVRAVYALVRVADEIVDGVAAEAGLDAAQQLEALDRFELETNRALAMGYSADVVVHAFARTARACGIDEHLTRPFFESMRMDLTKVGNAQYSATDHDVYVYGSAEVVGLMCLRVFVRDEQLSSDQTARLEHGARKLGEALQDINFLRDLRDDAARGRSYLSVTGKLDDPSKQAWVTRSAAALAEARAMVPALPRDARAAVLCAHDVFADLLAQIERLTVDELCQRRVRVGNGRKAWLAARAWARTRGSR